MDRKEAIRIGINCLDDYGLQRGDTNKIKALETLLSTTKLVEDVVGKLKEGIGKLNKLEENEELMAEQYMVRANLRWILTLLTEGE